MPVSPQKAPDFCARQQIRLGSSAGEDESELLDAYFDLQQGRGQHGRSGAGDLRGDLHVNAFGMAPAPHARSFNLKGEFV